MFYKVLGVILGAIKSIFTVRDKVICFFSTHRTALIHILHMNIHRARVLLPVSCQLGHTHT